MSFVVIRHFLSFVLIRAKILDQYEGQKRITTKEITLKNWIFGLKLSFLKIMSYVNMMYSPIRVFSDFVSGDHAGVRPGNPDQYEGHFMDFWSAPHASPQWNELSRTVEMTSRSCTLMIQRKKISKISLSNLEFSVTEFYTFAENYPHTYFHNTN